MSDGVFMPLPRGFQEALRSLGVSAWGGPAVEAAGVFDDLAAGGAVLVEREWSSCLSREASDEMLASIPQAAGGFDFDRLHADEWPEGSVVVLDEEW